jgi:hypothetical protein
VSSDLRSTGSRQTSSNSHNRHGNTAPSIRRSGRIHFPDDEHPTADDKHHHHHAKDGKNQVNNKPSFRSARLALSSSSDLDNDKVYGPAKANAKLHELCPEATGLFPHKFDCQRFVNCWNGRPHIHACAPGTLFHPRRKMCDFPRNVECNKASVERRPKDRGPAGRREPKTGQLIQNMCFISQKFDDSKEV